MITVEKANAYGLPELLVRSGWTGRNKTPPAHDEHSGDSSDESLVSGEGKGRLDDVSMMGELGLPGVMALHPPVPQHVYHFAPSDDGEDIKALDLELTRLIDA
ncbi:hypothetical protein FRC09_008318 [Ceratobasidium sp. 395]|nr:hypothetical protein FRC09_008318 [Ceratobasidium sp. 395]